MMYKRWLILWLGVHGKRHEMSRHVSLKAMLTEGL